MERRHQRILLMRVLLSFLKCSSLLIIWFKNTLALSQCKIKLKLPLYIAKTKILKVYTKMS